MSPAMVTETFQGKAFEDPSDSITEQVQIKSATSK